MQLIRKCPDCKTGIEYKTKATYNVGEKKNARCRVCRNTGENNPMYGKGYLVAGKKHGMYGKHHTKDAKKKISDAERGEKNHNYGKPMAEETKMKLYIANKGRKHTEETIKRMKIAQGGKNNPSYGRRGELSPIYGDKNPSKRAEVRKKLRELRLNQVMPNFNPDACKIIDEYGKKHVYNFQHALNGGEISIIGYSADGYDIKRNVVIEYLEKHHEKSKNKKKDKKRKQNIIDHLNCKFIEIWYDGKILIT